MLRALYRRAALAGSPLVVASLSPCAAPPLAAQATTTALRGTVTGSGGSAPQGARATRGRSPTSSSTSSPGARQPVRLRH